MADAPGGAIQPQADAATMVVIRPSVYAGARMVSLYVDGKYASDLEATRKVVLTLPPGEHKLVGAMGDITATCRGVTASVEAGKLYFVYVHSAIGADIDAVGPGETADLKKTLSETPITRAVVAAPQAPEMPAADLGECLAYADKELAEDDAEDKPKHHITAAHAFTAVP